MDPRNRADETLARARARGAFVVTPDNATSPMDASTTQRIPRDVIASGDDPDPTLRFQDEESTAWPTEDYQQRPHDHSGHPGGQQATSQQSSEQRPGGQQPGGQQPSGQGPGQGPPQAPQWPTAQHPTGQHPADQHPTDQHPVNQWSWPGTRFEPLNPEAARGLQW